MEEIWKDITDGEGLYQVSNLGRIKSFTSGSERVLMASADGRGYPSFCMNVNRKSIQRRVHQAVAFEFIGYDNKNKDLNVDHIDGDKSNNKLTNLRVVTRRTNITKCFRRDQQRLSSPFAGVSWAGNCNKWMSRIEINGKPNLLGYFEIEKDASDAYERCLASISKIKMSNMKPKEKADELVQGFYNKQTNVNQFGISGMQKEFAEFCVDQMEIAQRECYVKMVGKYEYSDQYRHLMNIRSEIANLN